MRVRVLFFGQLRDLVGRNEDEIEVANGATLETVFRHYTSEHPAVGRLANSIVMARNQSFASPGDAVADGDEIALMPPVSGGSEAWLASTEERDGSFFALTQEIIDTGRLRSKVQLPSDGALITFEGVTRDHTGSRKTQFLDYHGYAPLALSTMREIGLGVQRRFDIHRVGIVHRVGRLAIGESSVAIVVGSAHRQAAYDASLEAINVLKKRVPIWKKEYFSDGEVWVDGAWDDQLPRPDHGTATP